MATTKTINTRIQLRYDTLENWKSTTTAGKGALLVLNKGEMALCSVPPEIDNTTGLQIIPPAILVKVGDGTTTFENLPWVSALAADVHGWAKKDKKPTYTAAEIQGLSDYISGEIQDTDTQYKIEIEGRTIKLFSKDKGGNWGTEPVSTVDVPTSTLVEGTTNGTVKFNGTDVAVHGLKSAAYAETTAFDAAGAAAGVKTELTGTTTDTWATNKTLNAVHNEATAAAATASAAQTAAEGAQSTADSALAKANAAMPKVGGDFTNAPTVSGVAVATINTVEDAKSDAIAAAKTYTDKKDGETLQAAKDYADTKTAGLTGAMHFKGVVTGGTLPAASDYAEGDVVLFGSKEYVAYRDGATMKWAELGDEGSHVLKTQTINGHALSGNIDLTAGDVGAYTKAETNSAITTEIEKLDVAEKGGAGKYIQSISQTDGKIAAVEAAMPTALKNPNALTFGSKTYDGSAAAKITAADLGAVTDVSGKLDKMQSGSVSNDGTYVYTATLNEGVVGESFTKVDIDFAKTPSALPVYDAASNIKVGTALVDDDAASKGYVDGKVTTELGKHAGIDKVGTVTSVATGTGLKLADASMASTTPTIEIDDAVIFILNGGSATTVI